MTDLDALRVEVERVLPCNLDCRRADHAPDCSASRRPAVLALLQRKLEEKDRICDVNGSHYLPPGERKCVCGQLDLVIAVHEEKLAWRKRADKAAFALAAMTAERDDAVRGMLPCTNCERLSGKVVGLEADLAFAREEIARLNVNEARLRAAAQALDGAIGPCSYDVGEKIMALRAALSASPSEALDVVRRAQQVLASIQSVSVAKQSIDVWATGMLADLARVFGEAGLKGGR